jgi:hypothetical protein
MADQLTYSTENPLMISTGILSWCGGVMFIKLVIDYGKLAKVSLRKKEGEVVKGVDGWAEIYGGWFCGPCVCVGVFLL